MLRIIKWFFFCFIMLMMWQIAQTMDNDHQKISNTTLKLSNDLEKSAQNIIKKRQKKIQSAQQNFIDSVQQAGQEYISEIMK